MRKQALPRGACWGGLVREAGVSDEALMGRLQAGDREALADLVVRYQQDMFRFCLHYVKDVDRAKELAQETFIRVYVARARFDVERKFRPWLLCIARNLCLNDLKRKKTVTLESFEEYAASIKDEAADLHLHSNAEGPADQAIEGERFAALRAMLAELDEESRELVRLRFFEQLPARDIAEVMGSTEGAIRTRLHRVLRRMRGQYEQIQEDL